MEEEFKWGNKNIMMDLNMNKGIFNKENRIDNI